MRLWMSDDDRRPQYAGVLLAPFAKATRVPPHRFESRSPGLMIRVATFIKEERLPL